MNRDLDAAIAEKICGWKLTPVGKDANGENECEILAKNGKFPEGYDLPHVGKLHKGFLTPQYSGDLREALKLCRIVGLPVSVTQLPLDTWKAEEMIAQACLDYFTDGTLPGWGKQSNQKLTP